MRVGVISMDEHAAGWSSAALTKVPKRNRQSERIATLRERGYSEQELAETQRLDRHNLLLVLLTLAALLLAASLYGWHMYANPAGAADSDVVTESEEGSGGILSGGTVADFFRSTVEAEEPAAIDEDDATTTPKAGRAAKSGKSEASPGPFILLGPPPASAPVAIPFAGPDKSAVRRTTVRALKSGKARMWKDNGERGYVLVSGATAYSDRTCRQVSYTLIPEIGDQRTSSPVQWCEVKRGDWREDAYTGR